MRLSPAVVVAADGRHQFVFIGNLTVKDSRSVIVIAAVASMPSRPRAMRVSVKGRFCFILLRDGPIRGAALIVNDIDGL